MKKLIYGIILMILFIDISSLSINIQSTDMETFWADSDWTFRREVIITEKSNHSLVDFPVKVTFEHNGHIKPDGTDIRVIDNGSEIPYNLEYINESHATIIFEVNITASSSKSIYVYYGNPEAPPPNYPLVPLTISEGITGYAIIDNSVYIGWDYTSWGWSNNVELWTDFKIDFNGNGDPTDDNDLIRDYGTRQGGIGRHRRDLEAIGLGDYLSYVQTPIYVDINFANTTLRVYRNHPWVETTNADFLFMFSPSWDYANYGGGTEQNIVDGTGWVSFIYNSSINPRWMAFRDSASGEVFAASGINIGYYYCQDAKESSDYDRVITFDGHPNSIAPYDQPDDARIYWYADDTNGYENVERISSILSNPPQITIGKEEFPVSLPYVVIDQVYVSNEKASVGSVQTVGFHAKWGHNGSDVIEGKIYVNDLEYYTNQTGWVIFSVSSSIVGREEWAVTEVNCGGVTIYVQKVPNAQIIWVQIVSGIEILSYNGYYNSLAGCYIVAGEVINTGSTNANFVNVTVKFYDSYGEILGTMSSPIARRILYPGEKSPFKVIFEDYKAKQVDHYEVSLEFSGFDWYVQIPSLEILTSQYSAFKDELIGFGTVKVEGEIMNTGETVAENVLVYATFYDKYGNVIDAQVGGQEGGLNLEPNEIGCFIIELAMPNERIDVIANYSLTSEIYIENPSVNYEYVVSEAKIFSEHPYIPPLKAQYYGPISLKSGTRLRIKLSSSGTVEFFIMDKREFEDFLRLGPDWAVGHFYNKTNQVDLVFIVPYTDEWYFLIGNSEVNSVNVLFEVYKQIKWYEFDVGVDKEFYKGGDKIQLYAKIKSNQVVTGIEVRFKIINPNGLCVFNCSRHTNVNGWANVTFNISTEEGKYTLLAETLVEYSKIMRNNASFLLDLTPPVATFTYEPVNPKKGETVSFNASASHDELSMITNYEWDFGDGTSGTGVIVNHVYARPGNYTVTLKVTDVAGNFNTHTTIITVEEPFNLLLVIYVIIIMGAVTCVTVWVVIKQKRKLQKAARHYSFNGV